MVRRRSIFTVLAAALVSAACAPLGQLAGQPVSAEQLEGDPAAFDGRLVTLTGQVQNVRLVPGPRSRPRQVFELVDGSRSVRVHWSSWPSCSEGNSATVDGRYRKRDNIVTASWVSCY